MVSNAYYITVVTGRRYHAKNPVQMKKRQVILFACASLAAGAAAGAEPRVPNVPPQLAVPSGQVLLVKALATGVQNYACSEGRSGLEWTFKGPQAELNDEAGRAIGKHYAGPTWEAADASKVVGRLVSSADSESRDAIPQLLLASTQNSGSGVFANVKSIQRLQTSGGLPPKEPCQKDQLGRLVQSPYKAVYYFYGDAR
jgi:hypothetical protein